MYLFGSGSKVTARLNNDFVYICFCLFCSLKFLCNEYIIQYILQNACATEQKLNSDKKGWSSAEFDASDRTKRRKTEDLHEIHSTSELVHAMSLHASGVAATSNVLKNIIKSPTRASKYQAALKVIAKSTRDICRFDS